MKTIQFAVDTVKYKNFDIILLQDNFGTYSAKVFYKSKLTFAISGFDDINEIEEESFRIIDANCKVN